MLSYLKIDYRKESIINNIESVSMFWNIDNTLMNRAIRLKTILDKDLKLTDAYKDYVLIIR